MLMRIRFFVQGGNKKMERAQAILPETNQIRANRYKPLPMFEEIGTAATEPYQPAWPPSPPVPAPVVADTQTQKADDQFLQEEEWPQAKAKAMVPEQHSDTPRHGMIALGISGLVWGALAACFGLVPMAIATTVAVVLACLTLIYRVCSQEVAPIEEID